MNDRVHDAMNTGNERILLRVKTVNKYEIRFVVIDASDSFLNPPDENAFRPIIGKELPAGDLSPEVSIIDEWAEFVMRAKFMPYITTALEEREEETTSHMLQYSDTSQDWFVVKLCYNRKSDLLQADIYPFETFEDQSMLWHLLVLKQYKEMTRFITENGQWTVDLPSRTIFLSKNMARTLEISRSATIVPMSRLYKMMDGRARKRIKTLLLLKGQERMAFQLTLQLPSGASLYLHSYAVPIKNASGTVVRMIGSSENITKSAQGKAIITNQASRFQRVIDSGQDIFVFLDDTLCFSYLSSTAKKVLGFYEEEYLGRPFLPFIETTKQQGRLRREIAQLAQGTKHNRIVCRLMTVDHGYKWFSLTAFSIPKAGADGSEIVVAGRDISKENEYIESLQYMADHDAMTNLFNHKSFWAHMQAIYERADRNICLVLLDINGLKIVNDIYGNLKGDEAIQRAGRTIQKEFEQSHFIARFGGDSFAVVLENMDMEYIEKSCKNIERFFTTAEDRELPLSLSWGVACKEEAPQGAHALFGMAERRMNGNKSLNKNSLHSQVVYSLREAMRVRNIETADHLERMQNMVIALGSHLQLPSFDFNRLLLLSCMHDIGKLGVPDHIIAKPGKLDEEEWAIMKGHCASGFQIAHQSDDLISIAHEILSHHERWDGKGYPNGLSGDEIPLLSQIIAVVDAYDVMTHARVYKSAQSHEFAMDEIRRCSGTQFSPRIADMFLSIFSTLTQAQMQAFTGGTLNLP